MAIYLKGEEGVESPLPQEDEENLLVLPAAKEHLAPFPSGCTIIHTLLENGGEVNRTFGFVEWVAFDLENKGYKYKINLSSGGGKLLAKEANLQYAPDCPVWIAIGADQTVPATILKSYKQSLDSELEYALKEPRDGSVYVGITSEYLKFRKDGNLPAATRTSISRPTENKTENRSVPADTKKPQIITIEEHANDVPSDTPERLGDVARLPTEAKPQPTSDSNRNSEATSWKQCPKELYADAQLRHPKVQRPSFSEPPYMSAKNEPQPLSGSHRNSEVASSKRRREEDDANMQRRNSKAQRSSFSESSTMSDHQSSRRIIIFPAWAPFARFKASFWGDHGERLETLQEEYRCRVRIWEPSRRNAEIIIDGSDRAIEELTKIVEIKAANSVEKEDMCRMLYELCRQNHHHVRGHAVYMRTPPNFRSKKWVSIVLLGSDSKEQIGIFIGRNGTGGIPIKVESGCEVDVKNSKFDCSYIRISGESAENVLEGRLLVGRKLRLATEKVEENRRRLDK